MALDHSNSSNLEQLASKGLTGSRVTVAYAINRVSNAGNDCSDTIISPSRPDTAIEMCRYCRVVQP